MKILIHAGRHKTGTSFIQEFLAGNEETLARKHGVFYPRTGRSESSSSHHLLFRPLVLNKQPLDGTTIREIIGAAAAAGCHTLLFSSEILGRVSLTPSHLELLRSAFEGHEIRLILYFRRQGDFLESTYANRIRIGLLSAPKKIHGIDPCLDYCEFCAPYVQVFGKEALIVRSYDNALSRGLVVDFLDAIGVSSTKGFCVEEGRVNQRLSWRYLALLRQANRFGWTRKLARHRYVLALVSRLESRFPEFMDRPRPISPEQRDAVTLEYQKSNDRLARDFTDSEHLFS